MKRKDFFYTLEQETTKESGIVSSLLFLETRLVNKLSILVQFLASAEKKEISI